MTNYDGAIINLYDNDSFISCMLWLRTV
jgi:hypothetical protein